MIKLQQIRALTSHFESFWSIVQYMYVLTSFRIESFCSRVNLSKIDNLDFGDGPSIKLPYKNFSLIILQTVFLQYGNNFAVFVRAFCSVKPLPIEIEKLVQCSKSKRSSGMVIFYLNHL